MPTAERSTIEEIRRLLSIKQLDESSESIVPVSAETGIQNPRRRRVARRHGSDPFLRRPAAGDAGGAIGAALAAWHIYKENPRRVAEGDLMHGSFLGPSFEASCIRRALDAAGARYTRLAENMLLDHVAALLAEGKVVGWFQAGRARWAIVQY